MCLVISGIEVRYSENVLVRMGDLTRKGWLEWTLKGCGNLVVFTVACLFRWCMMLRLLLFSDYFSALTWWAMSSVMEVVLCLGVLFDFTICSYFLPKLRKVLGCCLELCGVLFKCVIVLKNKRRIGRMYSRDFLENWLVIMLNKLWLWELCGLCWNAENWWSGIYKYRLIDWFTWCMKFAVLDDNSWFWFMCVG